MRGITIALGFAMGMAVLLGGGAAQAQSNYPNRAIHIIVPYPAGGIVDIVARAVTEQVGRDWKQIDGGGIPARRQQQYRHRGGRTQRARWLHLAGHGTRGAGQSHPLQGRRLGRDEGPQMRGARGVEPERSAGHPSMPVKTIGEFVELARSKPGYLNFGNPGTGSSIDLSAQKLFQVANIKLTNIGYKGQPPALIDLMTNLMHFEIVSLELALPHIKAGTVKPLAVFTDKRVADLPDVPTIAEAGFAGSRLRSLVWHLCAVDDAGRAGRENSSRPSTRHCKIPTSSVSYRLPTFRVSRCR